MEGEKTSWLLLLASCMASWLFLASCRVSCSLLASSFGGVVGGVGWSLVNESLWVFLGGSTTTLMETLSPDGAETVWVGGMLGMSGR